MTATQREEASQRDAARPAVFPPHRNSLYRRRPPSFNYADGQLGRVLEDAILPTTDGLCLYYASRRQNSAALRAFIDFLRANLRSVAPGIDPRPWAIFGLLRKQLIPLDLRSCDTVQKAFLDCAKECVRKSCDFVPDPECHFQSPKQDRAWLTL